MKSKSVLNTCNIYNEVMTCNIYDEVHLTPVISITGTW